MKKIALIIMTIVCSTGISLAQNAEVTPDGLVKNPRFRMGISAAPVISWFNTDGNDDFVNPDGPRLNINYGLHLDFGLGTSRNYYFSTGLFVMNTGGNLIFSDLNSEGTTVTESVDYRFNYVNIPLTMMLRTNEVGYMVYFARVGFDNGFNIKSNFDVTTTIEGGQPTSSEDLDSPDFASLYRAALHIEGGVEFNLTGTTNLFVSLEWNNGLNNIFSKKAEALKGGEFDRIKGTSNAILVNVGVYF